MTSFSDEDLTRWLDGQADPSLSRQIEAALSDPALSARVAALEIPQDALRAGFDSLLSQAPAAVLPPPTPFFAQRTAWVAGLMAASLGAFALGFALSKGLDRQGTREWTEAAAIYHALYAPETVAALAPTEAETRTQLGAMSAILGADLSEFARIDGFTFRRAQPLRLGTLSIVHIVYVDDDGLPYALCLTLDTSLPDTPRTQPIEGLAATVGSEGRIGYLVVGAQDNEPTVKLADQVEALL